MTNEKLSKIKNLSLQIAKDRQKEMDGITLKHIEIKRLTSGFGCKSAFVQKFSSAFLDVDLEYVRFVPFDLIPGTIFVPIGNSNSHDYPLKQPVCLIREDFCFDPARDEEGNHLGLEKHNPTRYATIEEVENFYAKIEKNPTNFLRYVEKRITLP